MLNPDEYRARALEALTNAEAEADPVLREIYRSHADEWASLARKADIHGALGAAVANDKANLETRMRAASDAAAPGAKPET